MKNFQATVAPFAGDHDAPTTPAAFAASPLPTFTGPPRNPVEPPHPSGAGGRNYQWLRPIDYVKNTLSFLKRNFLLHKWPKPLW